jgi:hypothetical protein
MADRKVYPVPELILDDHIRIEGVKAGQGSMDNSARLMRVPLMDTPACRHVRAHEMAHARFSPDKPICPAGVERITIQRVEDMRMNTLCREHGLHDAMDAPIVDGPIWDRLLTGERENLTAGISTYNTGDWSEFVKRAHPSDADMEFIASVADALKADPSWRTTQRQAQAVEAYLASDDPDSDPDSGDASDDENSSASAESASATGSPDDYADDDAGEDASPDDGESDDDSPADDGDDSDRDMDATGSPVDLSGDILDMAVDAKLASDAKREEKTPFEKGVERLEQTQARSRGNAGIVPAKIDVRPMPKRLAPSKFKSRAKVPADRGMVPKHMNRYCTDKAIFAGRGRKRDHGGTILIDASGSMSIHDSEIDSIMEICPLGTIATYSGQTNDHGDLWVIAQKGKRATGKLRPPGMMNLIDVAALEWMVKQPGPYFWVCDGYLTGAGRGTFGGEKAGRNVYDRALEIVKRHGIIMVPSLDRLPEVMRETLGK